MKGMEMAFKLKITVLFVSSDTSKYIKVIEKLKSEYDLCVDHITKPFTEKEFLKTILSLLHFTNALVLKKV